MMYIYKILSWNNKYEIQEVDYIKNDKLYDTEEFKILCNNCIEEVRKIYRKISKENVKQHLIVHYGFSEIKANQTFAFDED